MNQLEKIGDGSCSAQVAFESVRDAVKEGAASEGARAMAAIADRPFQHLERDMNVWLKNSPIGSENMELYNVRLTLRMRSQKILRQYDVPVLPMRLVFAKIFTSGHSRFRSSLLGLNGTLGVASFWENMFHDPEVAASHPVCIDPRHAAHADHTSAGG